MRVRNITVFSFMIVILVVGISSKEVWADGPLEQRFRVTGPHDIVADGVGLLNTTSGSFSLAVPGTVVKAFLYWAGYNTTSFPHGDDTVNFSVDSGPAAPLTADYVFGPDLWFDEDVHAYHYVYVEEVTALVLTGSHSYNVSDVTIGNNFGAGIIVVYEDPSSPICMVQINDGLDSMFWNFPAPRGPNSEVFVIEFDAVSYNRTMKSIFIAGGVEPVNRPNALWYLTGTGIPPTQIIEESGAIEYDGPPAPYPFGSNDGDEWDSYTTSITVPGGHMWVAFQTESVDDVPGENGASLLWVGLGSVLCSNPPVGGAIVPMKKIILVTPWIGLLSIIAVSYVAAIIKKRK